MFCFQCEQTAGCTGCTGNTGVCGKKADTAQLQDELTGALIGLARAVDDTSAVSKKTWQTIIEGLFTTITNVSFDTRYGAFTLKEYIKPDSFFPTFRIIYRMMFHIKNSSCYSNKKILTIL